NLLHVPCSCRRPSAGARRARPLRLHARRAALRTDPLALLMKAALLLNHLHFAAPTNHSILDSGNTAFTPSRPILPIQNIKSSDGIRFEDGGHLGGARPVFVKDALDAPRHGRVFDDDADLAAAVH